MTSDIEKRLEEIRRASTPPLEGFNSLNDIGKAYAYGSDVGFLLQTLDTYRKGCAEAREVLKEYAQMPIIEMDGIKEDLSIPAKQALSQLPPDSATL